MLNDLFLLTDEELSNISGGTTILFTQDNVPGGHTITMPSGLSDGAFQIGKFVGVQNGTAPMFGDQNPVAAVVI